MARGAGKMEALQDSDPQCAWMRAPCAGPSWAVAVSTARQEGAVGPALAVQFLRRRTECPQYGSIMAEPLLATPLCGFLPA